MKLRKLLSFLFIAVPMMASAQVIEINDIRFPDDNFRLWLTMQYGEQHVFTEEEIQNLTILRISGCDIESLQGIECFTALTQLYCSNNKLTKLDLSKNKLLAYLDCSGNLLTSMDLSPNTALKNLFCGENQLTSLDVSQNTLLTNLWCDKNQLPSLDVSQNTALTNLVCSYNQLTSLDLSPNTALTELHCQNNQLASLLLPCDASFDYVQCHANQLSGDAMDAFIATLPQNPSEGKISIYIRDEKDAEEGNICTREQVAAMLQKGWMPLCYSVDEETWTEYEGTEDEGTGGDGGEEEEDPKEETQGIKIDEANFPDENFRNCLLAEPFGEDGVITDEELAKVIMLNVDGKDIASLEGAELFTSLIHLSCDNNLLTSLDVSPFASLMYLSCHSNQISGEAMDALIEGLPQKTSDESEYKFCVYDATDESEGNVCTQSQADAIKAKGWTPYYFDGEAWVEFKNADDEGDNDDEGKGDDDDDNKGDDGNDDNNDNNKEEPDAIAQPADDSADAAMPIYNLAGQRLESLQGKKGVYIIGSKKVVVK